MKADRIFLGVAIPVGHNTLGKYLAGRFGVEVYRIPQRNKRYERSDGFSKIDRLYLQSSNVCVTQDRTG